MIDLNLLRADPAAIKENCRRRGADDVDVDGIVVMDAEWRSLLTDVQELRARRNMLSKACKHDPDARDAVRSLKQEIADKEQCVSDLKRRLDDALAWMPNLLGDDVPDGHGDEDNVELRRCGDVLELEHALDHQAIGEHLGIIDTQRGAKVAQSGFYYWKGAGAQLASAMFFWTQQQLTQMGFTLFITPCAAKEETLFGTGYLPFFADQTYQLSGQDLALIGTSEQTLVGYHGGETLSHDALPLKYAAYSPCFRTEAGSYGKETRGIFRVHQFHKVEQIIFCDPDESDEHHRFCLDVEERLLQQLGIPYRVVNVCIGDLGAPGFKKYDVEAHFPGFGGYREVCSNTNLIDFQARRLGIRFSSADGRKGFVHTISATAVTDRVVCAILENGQQSDGSVVVPEVLRALTGFDRITPQDS